MEPMLGHTTQPNIDALRQGLKIISQSFSQHTKAIAHRARPMQHKTGIGLKPATTFVKPKVTGNNALSRNFRGMQPC
jgi:hypothetical protein